MERLKKYFLLREDIHFLNFGSFGACPKPIFDAYQNFQRQLEYEPVQFITKTGIELLQESRRQLAEFVNCKVEDLVFVPNPTQAVNVFLRNLSLREGDEILTTNLEYGACDRALDFYSHEKKVHVVRAEITLPIVSKESLIEEFWSCASVKTKVIFISQITSSTALILPVKEICEEAKKRGIITIVDGAHVPAHIPFDFNEIQADFYTGTCHKWMMTPKGSSFMIVSKKFHEQLMPLIVSWGYDPNSPLETRLFDYHQFNGTRDFSAYLCIPESLKFMKETSWLEKANEKRIETIERAKHFSTILSSPTLAPTNETYYGQMASFEIIHEQASVLKEQLYTDFHIEIPIMTHNDKVYLRFTNQVFNTEADFDQLEKAIKTLHIHGNGI